MTRRARTVRLLPWEAPGGKRCYLSSDGGFLPRFADQVEAVQLGMGAGLLRHADTMLLEPRASARELRFLAARLTEALADALRVAESRGDRLDAIDDERLPDDDHDARRTGGGPCQFSAHPPSDSAG
jgi:hypothetical protein